MPEIARSVRHLATRPGLFGAVSGYLGARRGLLPFLATVGYVAAGAIRVDRGQGGRVWLVGLLALVCAFVAAAPSVPGNGLRDDGQRRVGLVAYALWGFALVLASMGAAAPDLVLDLAGGAGALGSSVVAARALGHVRGGHGMAESLPRSPRGLLYATTALLFLAFGLALAASILAIREPTATPWEPLPHDAHTFAAAAALVVLGGSAWETLRTRRLALEAGDRSLTAVGCILAVTVLALGALLVGQGSPDRVLRLAVATAALLVTVVCTAGDAVTHARRGRRAITLLIFGGPVVLLGGLAAEGPGRSFPALLVTGLVALFVGSVVAYLEQPLRRAEGRLLDAVERAHLALVRADPETSIRDALTTLRTFAGPSSESPELWSLSPPRVLTIDGAGYPHERTAPLPQHLLDVAEGELEATVRTELLDALVVRRPDLRPLARWMDERGALCATLVTREGEVEGVIVLPRGARSDPMSLEEVRAVKRLADAFSGASAAVGALSRSLDRERAATTRADAIEDVLLGQERRERTAGARSELATARLAEEAMGGPYAPSARVAFDVIERRVRLGAPLVVVAPNGSAVVAYLARAHLAGPRRQMPFVVVDGAKHAEHDVARWSDASRSPLALADRGLLVIEDAARLPTEVQQLLGDALAQRRAPWEGAGTLEVAIALTLARDARETKGAAEGAGEEERVRSALDAVLAARLDEAIGARVTWPRLCERGEDLRSLVLAGLAREGVRVRGAALGIEDAAYEELANYAWPGEDAELGAVVKRLAGAAEGEVVRVAEGKGVGLGEG
jgi:hypothetical protein